ncbi:MAG: DUF1801 domain-containing protein [Gemmatimonadetes bacterium]|nr:DUF1801 domain-containing protein [Gemmatimonadota bacterium]
MAEPKTTRTTASVAAFLAAIEDPKRRADALAVKRLMEQASGEKAAMWGTAIVGFGSYHYVYASGQGGDWPLVAFSPRKQNLVLYIMPGFDRYSELMARLGKCKTGKSCLYLNSLRDVDVSVLEELVRASVRHMATSKGAAAATRETSGKTTKAAAKRPKKTK